MPNNDSALDPPPDTVSAPDANLRPREQGIKRPLGAALAMPWIVLAPRVAIVALGWDDLPVVELLGWAALGFACAAYRSAMAYFYERAGVKSSAAQQRFSRHHELAWILSGVVWGITALIFFGRAPIHSQLICWLIMSGAVIYSVYSVASSASLVRRYLWGLAFTLIGSLGFRIFELGAEVPLYLYGFMALAAGECLLLWWVGLGIYRSQRNTDELLRRNQVLIDLLTQQREDALSAVARKNRLLVSAAHDMRQPVQALALYADSLRAEPEAGHNIVPKIVRATRAVDALCESLFNFARFDFDQVQLHVEPVSIEKLLRDLELQHRPAAEAKGLTFRVRGLKGDVLTDPVQVRRMLGNLLANAINYTETGGVLLAARNGRDGVRIEVWDTGIGIAPEHLPNLFLEFYKVPERPGTLEGFGLGLSIVARLSDSLSHPVTVRSRLHRGSVFGMGFSSAQHVKPLRRGATPQATEAV